MSKDEYVKGRVYQRTNMSKDGYIKGRLYQRTKYSAPLLGVAVLLLTIPSTRNHLFLVYGANIILVIAGLPLTTLSIRNGISYSTASTGQVYVGCCRPPSDDSIQQETFLSLSCLFHVWCPGLPYDFFIHLELSPSP